MHINNHWALVVLDFIKTEVQILNSLGVKSGMRNKDLEKALVIKLNMYLTYCVFNYNYRLIKLNMYLH